MGALIGGAIGDALGAPFEFKPAGQYQKSFPDKIIGGVGEMVGGGSFDWEPGEFTDDSQMAFALTESLIVYHGFNPDDIWKRFVNWAETASDIGNITRSALNKKTRIGAALSAHQSIGRSASNGALMRAFPMALAYIDEDTKTTMDAAYAQATLTHFDPAAQWGAAIAVELIRRAVLGAYSINELDREIDAVLSFVPANISEEISTGASVDTFAGISVGDSIGISTDIRAQFSPILASDWYPGISGPGNGSVWTCLAQAIWAVRTTKSFEDALVAAINLGDDTDTVACVTGAIAGAIYGIQAIPSRWTTYVHGHVSSPDGEVKYDYQSLQDMARCLIGLKPVILTIPEPTSVSAEIAPNLYAANLLGAAATPDIWAVISLCRHDNLFSRHPVRREIVMRDEEGDSNPDLMSAVTDAVNSIDAFLAEGLNVVVHCHGGRSRTALILKAWKMRREGVDERVAHKWLLGCWPLYSPYNETFREFLRKDWK
jgi:ADP-ribosyl-[dinitrogen reductase] hydrolase